MTDERGRRVWILPSFPTPNGDMHVGHLAGPFIAADVLRRSRLISGDDPRLLLGTVGHQSQVATAAREAGRSFYAEAEANTASIRATLTSLLVEPSVFVEPRDLRYPGISLEVFQRLVDSGYVVAAQVPTHFCDRCSAFRFEAFLGGSCPHCGSGQTAGIECEQCALPYSEHELVGAFCAICEEPTSLIEVERWVLRLESLRTQLIIHHERSHTTDTLARHLRRVLASPLPDFPASIIGTDGVSVPAPVAEIRHVLYSGFELVGRYLAAVDLIAQEEDRDWLEELRANDAADMVVLFGFDNAYLRGVVFTAMIIALEIEGLNVPTAYLTNEFYELEGQKFSTSRNHAIWGRDPRLTARPDDVRLHVSLTRPDIERTNFSLQDLDAKASQFSHVVSTWLARAKVVDSEQNGELGVSQLLSEFRTVLEVATRRIARYADVPTFNPRLLALEGVRVVHEGAELARRGYPHHRRSLGMTAALQLWKPSDSLNEHWCRSCQA